MTAISKWKVYEYTQKRQTVPSSATTPKRESENCWESRLSDVDHQNPRLRVLSERADHSAARTRVYRFENKKSNSRLIREQVTSPEPRSPYMLRCAAPYRPEICPFQWGSGPHLIDNNGPTRPTIPTASRSKQPFLQNTCSLPTDRQTAGHNGHGAWLVKNKDDTVHQNRFACCISIMDMGNLIRIPAIVVLRHLYACRR